jgi:hypothetical protein
VARTFTGTWQDPTDVIWLGCARRLGMKVERSDATYASWDGVDTLTLCTPATFDPDDSIAQLVLHELCHGLVQGRTNLRKIDWGLINTDDVASAIEEHACHRLQAALLDRYGLRAVLGVTTDWRPYWDALPADPLADGDDPAIAKARAAWPDAVRGPWSAAIDEALRATRDVALATAPFSDGGDLAGRVGPQHPLGIAAGEGSCGTCAWSTDEDGTDRCRAEAREGHPGPAISVDWTGCYRWEPRLDIAACRSCGACCRQGFHMVTVDEGDPFLDARPDLVRRDAHGAHVPRPRGFCAALETDKAPWTCSAYAVRPQSCRDFEEGGESCLIARRRVGLSRL